MTLDEVRQKYPQYAEVPDDKLASALYDKYYKDKISFDEFSSKIGYSQAPSGAVSPAPTQAEPKREGEVLEGAGEVIQSVGASVLGSVGAGLGGIYELIRTGDADKAAEAVKFMQQSISERFAPQTQRGEDYLEAGMGAADAAGQTIKAAPSMLIGGVASPFIGQDDAKQLASDIRTEQTGKLVGEGVFEATGSPFLAAAAETLTPDLSEIATAGAGGAITRGLRGAASSRASGAVKNAEINQAKAGGASITPKGKPDESAIQRTAQAIQKATPEEVAALVDSDPKIMQAIESLEIDAEPVFSQLSRNQQYREVEGGLRAMPGSDLNAQAIRFVEATKRKADELIETFGGVKDKALLSDQFREDTLRTIDDLAESANEVYGQIDAGVKKSETAVPESTIDFLYSKADELGGIDNLQPKFKKLIRDLEENPTIGLIDQRRKDMGQAAFKNSGLFKDAEEGFAKAIYGRLTDDMNSILESKGMKEISDTGKALVKERKLLEGNLQSLLGKQLSKDLTTVLGSATKGLSQGRVKQFVDTVNKIPEEYRQRAVVTSLNDVFRGRGQSMDAFNANDYLKFWNELQRNPRARTALFKELPKGSRGALAGLAEISKGINQSDRNVIRTGVIQSFFEPNTGLVSKMLGNTGRALAATKAGPAGSALYSAVSDLLSQSTSPSQRVASLIATPQFQNTVKMAINEKVTNPAKASAKLKEATEKLKKTRQYQDWVNTLPEADKLAAQAGFLTYLATVGEQEQEQ
ncbi:MAG: hypothetical protein ABJG42_24785 [Vibrio splendidus]